MALIFSKKTVKRLILLILLSITLAFAIRAMVKSVDKISESDIDDIVHQEIPINRLLSNNMSSFEQTQKFDKYIEYFMRYWDIKGGSFALMYNDSLIYAKGYGYANIEDSIKCDVNNLFRVASVSKLITATAIMKLCEEEKLSLNSQVFGKEGILNDSIFLNLKNKNLKRIKVEHLLRHTAGFSSPFGDPAFNPAGVARVLDKELPLSVDDMVIYATRNRLRTIPGGSYKYSNLGYIVLSKIIEKVTNLEYETYVKDSILAPAGCYDMHLGRNFSKNKRDNEVSYYEVKEAEPIEAYDGSGKFTMKSDGGNDVNLLSGAGGWIASPVELLKFVASINNNSVRKDILSPTSVKKMTYFSKKVKPIGWASVTSYEWLRSGSMAGTSALIKRQKNGYTWVFVSNTSSWNGPYLSKYMSLRISQALASRVKKWPKRDLFELDYFDSKDISDL